MSITWREGVTTLAAAGAVVLERAYFWNWSWTPLSSTRWVIVTLGALFAIEYLCSYVLDTAKTDTWTAISFLIVVATLVTGILGLVFAASDYVVLMMSAAILFWISAMVAHLAEAKPTMKATHHPAY